MTKGKNEPGRNDPKERRSKALSVADLLAPGRTPGPPVDVTERYRDLPQRD